MIRPSLDPKTQEDPRDAAAYWFARVLSGRMDEAERRDFEHWRRTHPDHDREFRRAEGIWNATLLVSPERLRALAREPRAPRSARRRRLAIGLGAAGAAAVVAGVVWPSLDGTASYSDRYSTGHGGRSQARLPDGSLVDLNTDTVLSVAFYGRRRVVELAAGEAAFAVAHDTQRPFHVRAGETVVRVTGTRFDVRRDGESVLVAVESGSVEVGRGPWWSRAVAQLGAGQTVRSGTQGGLTEVSHADVASLLAWRDGRIVFPGTPLAQAIAEMNRYAPYAIRLADPSLAQIPIAGVFSIDRTQSFLELLPQIAPVRVRRHADGSVTVGHR